MKKLRLRKAAIISLIIVLILAIPFCPLKRAVKVEFVEGQYDIQDFIGQKIRLLCKYYPVTGSFWFAEYIEVETDTFAELIQGIDIAISSSGQPNISGAYTSDRYGQTQIILEGRIEEVYGIDDAETYMHISSWDIVYPIDTGWFDRNEFFEEHLILLDLILK